MEVKIDEKSIKKWIQDREGLLESILSGFGWVWEAKLGPSWEGKSSQDRKRQDKTGQDRTRQDKTKTKTRQDKTLADKERRQTKDGGWEGSAPLLGGYSIG